MKKIIFIVLLILTTVTTIAQVEGDKRIIVEGQIDPSMIKNDGVDLILAITTNQEILRQYFRLGALIEIFPELHDIPYYHLIGRFGINFNLINDIRVYGGVRGGLIRRDFSGYALMGVEGGIDWFIPWIDPIFIGISAVIDEKTDNKLWGNDDSHTVKRGIVRICIRF